MANRTLPTGTVTFLFSDIEGSTRLVQDLGPAAFTLHLHDQRLLRPRNGREQEQRGERRQAKRPAPHLTTNCARGALAPGSDTTP